MKKCHLTRNCSGSNFAALNWSAEFGVNYKNLSRDLLMEIKDVWS